VAEFSVSLAAIIEEESYEILHMPADPAEVLIKSSDLSRPGLELAGFFDYFNYDRVQIIGNVEYAYMEKMEADHGSGIMRKLMSHKIHVLFSAVISLFARNC
jgi:HPr kinase/phosphorylase